MHKRLLKPAAVFLAIALNCAAGAARAGDVTGTLLAIDLPRDTLQVEDVTVFIDHVDITGLKVGDYVYMTYDEEGDGEHLQTIEKIPAPR